jgi:uncharacterized membrane protein
MKSIESLELRIGKFLRIGVIFAGSLMLIGWLSKFNFTVNSLYVFDTYDQIPLKDILAFHYIRKDWGTLVSYLGLTTLISLPVIRVFLTTIIFIKQKEFALAAIAFVVLLALFFSMALGIEH